MNLRPRNAIFINQLSERTIVLVFGFLTMLFTSVFLLRFNSEFGGAKNDSQFYDNMYRYIQNYKSLIPLNSYEVSSSPIFVHALGFFLLLFGNVYPIILSLSFLLMSAASMIFFEKLIQHTHLNFKIILTTMFCGSGYFVAPMLNPTSDSPMILFLTLSLYAFCFSRRKLMSISLFCLVSVRQSLGWILVVFVVWDLYSLRKFQKLTFRDILLTYSLSFMSLFVTFIYFSNNLFPDSYTEVQPGNVFSVPNFLSVVQIGISLLVLLTPLLFLGIKSMKLTKEPILLMLYFLLLAFSAFVFPQKKLIVDGLGYLSVLHGDLNLAIVQITVVSALGFLVFIVLAQDWSSNSNKFLYLFMFVFVTSSLVMPIPFLRYFQIPLILAVVLMFRYPRVGFKKRSDWVTSIVISFLTVGNLGAIAL